MRRGIFKGKDQICNVFCNGAVSMLREFELAAMAASNIKKCPVWWVAAGDFVVKSSRIQCDGKTFFTAIWKIKAIVESDFWHGVFLCKVVVRNYYSFMF